MPSRSLRRLTVLALPLTAACADARPGAVFEEVEGKVSLLETIPELHATNVDTEPQIDLCFSKPLDPRAFDDFDATLGSGPVIFDLEATLQLIPWNAAGQSDVPAENAWCPGSVLSLKPLLPLQSGLLYRVRLRPTVIGWNGEALETEGPGWVWDEENEEAIFVLEFTIREESSDEEPVESDSEARAISLRDLFEAGEVFDPQDARCGCHREPNALAKQVLDLETPESAFEDLVLREGLESTGFPMVVPRHPSDSFLLHKLLRDEEGNAMHRVRGEAMPPQAPLPHRDWVRLAHWIEAGAKFE